MKKVHACPFSMAKPMTKTQTALALAVAGGLLLACGDSGKPSAPVEDSSATPWSGVEPDAGGPAVDAGSSGPTTTGQGAAPEIVTGAATSLGLSGFSANGRIQPHGAATEYFFEYGKTTAYGSQTATRSLAPRLAAFYRESWDTSRAGFKGGAGKDLTFSATGAVSGGMVHYEEPTLTDYNHVDGIGLLHLVQYFYPGTFQEEFWEGDDSPTASFGGRDPDFRDARVRVSVRGTAWQPSGTELLWWAQVDTTHGHPVGDEEFQYSNWAHTGFNLTDALLSGAWEQVEYRLWNDTTDWTYAGTNRELNAALNRSVYVYSSLDDSTRCCRIWTSTPSTSSRSSIPTIRRAARSTSTISRSRTAITRSSCRRTAAPSWATPRALAKTPRRSPTAGATELARCGRAQRTRARPSS